jgi:hypothetical protein
MSLQIDTVISNKRPSPKLKQMLTDLRSNTGAWIDSIEEIRQQAHKEGFTDEQTQLLLKQYLSKFLKKDQIKYILYGKPRIEKQKNLTDKTGNIPLDVNVPVEPETVNIPTDYKIVVPDQVLEEETEQLQQEQEHTSETLETKPDYEGESLKMQLDIASNKVTELTAQVKNLEEKYKKAEARNRVSPGNNSPVLQGNTLKTKIVVNQVFREILLKGLKEIYANVVIDVSQNKYI